MTHLEAVEIAVFAERHNVAPMFAHTLPAVFEKVAEIGNRSLRSVVNEATYSNQPLADYVGELAVEVAAKAAL